MCNLIAVVSGKGGTGKTSFTANVGLALSVLGQRTLCLDCDIAMRNLDLALGLSDRAMMDFSDVAEGRCSLQDAVVTREKYPYFGFLSAPLCDNSILDVSARQVRGMVNSIRSAYDFCLIDAPAGIGLGFQLALGMADSVILVTTAEVSSLRDAQRTAMELSSFSTERVHLVVNRLDERLLYALRMTLDDAIDAAGLPLLGVIPEDRDIAFAMNRGIPVREYSYLANRPYDNIAKRLTGRRVPLLKL